MNTRTRMALFGERKAMSRMKRKLLRIGVTAAMGLAVTGLVPAGTASAAAPNCPDRAGGVGSTFFSVTCYSGPGSRYVAVASCTDGRTYIGQEARYSQLTWSTANCPSGRRVTGIGIGTR